MADVDIIYLEPDEEITSVIDRLRNSASSHVSLAVPRGSTLAQSIINLKLLKKSAASADKIISLVANDKITQNLGSQIGITVFSKVSDAQNAKIAAPKAAPVAAKESPVEANGLRIHSYDTDDDGGGEELGVEEAENVDDVALQVDDDIANEGMIVDAGPVGDISSKDEDEDEYDEKKAIRAENEDILRENQPAFSKRQVAPPPVVPEKKVADIRGSRKPLIIVASVLAFIFLVLAYVLVPSATAKIILNTEEFKFEGNITVDSNNTTLDAQKGLVPGTIEEVTKESVKPFDATGKKDVGTKATGTITIYNSQGDARTIVAGTRFSSEGMVFITNTSAKSPAINYADVSNAKCSGGQCVWPPTTVDVTVTAEKNGEAYNLSSNKTFTSTSLPTGFSAKNNAAFTGGTTKEVKIITAADLDKAEETLKTEATGVAKSELATKINDLKMVYSDKSIAVETLSATSDKGEGAEADTFIYTINVKVTALAFFEDNISKIANEKIKETVGEGKMIVSPDKSDVSYEVLGSEAGGTILNLSLNYAGKISSKLDEKKIQDEIKVKSATSAVKTIKKDAGVKDVIIKTRPSFIKMMPVLKNRIKVSFDFQ